MRLLIWLWEHTGTELFVTKGKWDWDEWHAFQYGRCEALGNKDSKSLPNYCHTEPHYYMLGRAWGRRQRMFEDVMLFVFAGLVFLAGLYAISELVTHLLAKAFIESGGIP